MRRIPSGRAAGTAFLASVMVLGACAAGGAGASTVAVAAGPQKTVTGSVIRRPSHTLAPGSTVSAKTIFGHRVFTSATNGVALVDTGQAQYPAASTNGGKTWKTNGPALHLNAAQAPLAVVDIGASNRNVIYAWGTGQVIDTTSNGGKQWYRSVFQGLPVAVVTDPQGHLVAFIDGSGTGSHGASYQYVSKNGGRTWRYDTTVGGS
ncbi:MAG: hypothetical protein WAK93_19325 [Solirubrobacteraceae bacterium]